MSLLQDFHHYMKRAMTPMTPIVTIADTLNVLVSETNLANPLSHLRTLCLWIRAYPCVPVHV